MNDDETPRKASAEELIDCLKSLPDEKVSAARIMSELRDSDSQIREALDELVVLGEVELCQRRGTGPRVWYKHRETLSEDSPREVADYIWRCYVSEDRSRRIADRCFQRRSDALQHLEKSAVVKPDDFEAVPYLDGVWRASTKGKEGYARMTAVVRKEPVYREQDTSDQTQGQLQL
ncbi:hypothetical protein [Salarchaeum japonicum]|uniref:hypothetical protein n=1 Tax=Salarchaeum japonicum TaxID=555573 RepID=UPI003C73E339